MPEQFDLPESQDLSATIDASLCSVWSRHTGSRPTDTSVELGDGVVRWIMPGDTAGQLKDAIVEHNEAGDGPERTITSYERETSAAVAKAMHRKITARISPKAKGGVAKQVFILEAFRRKY
jgi:hypothetical protein